MKKTFNYLPLVQALELIVQRTMNLKLKREDPFGEKVAHSISDIRISFLSNISYEVSYLNGIARVIDREIDTPEILITVCIEKKTKIFRHIDVFQDLYLKSYEGILSVLWCEVTNIIDALFDGFYTSKTKCNKYYVEEKTPPIYMDDSAFQLAEIEYPSKEIQTEFSELLQDFFLVPHVDSVSGCLYSKRKVWIVVDSSKNRIIQHQDFVEGRAHGYLFNSKKREYDVSCSQMALNFGILKNYFKDIRNELQKALYSTNRSQLESGIYPYLFMPSAMATLCHEALAGHMLSGYYIANETSTIFKGKLGKNIAKNGFMKALKNLEIWDCPRDKTMVAHYEYDMQGTPAKDVCLLKNGVVENYLLDKNSSARLHKENNGHSLAGSFVKEQDENSDVFEKIIPRPKKPEPRVSNLKVYSTSTHSLDDLKKQLLEKFGYYYIVESHAGEVNIETGTFELTVDYLIKVNKNGNKSYFHGGTLSANLTDFLSSIIEVSNHYGRTNGYCGAESGWVPTEEFAPAVSVYGINWAPNPLPEPLHTYSSKRDKYLPEKLRTKKTSFEYWINMRIVDFTILIFLTINI